MAVSNVMPIRPDVTTAGTDTEGSVVHCLWHLVSSNASGTVRLLLGAVEIGHIEVHEGGVQHAEIPGARGDEALRLLPRMPGLRASLGPESDSPTTTVTIDWRSVLDPNGELQAQSAPDEGSTKNYDALFREATAAYVQRRYRDALELYEQCAALRPDDRRIIHNLRRLRERIG